MTALTADRIAPQRQGANFSDTVAASQKIFGGALAALNSSGDLVEGAAGAGLKARGVNQRLADNSAGSAGDIRAEVESGTFRFANSSSGDAISRDDIGKMAWIVDDQTVALTSNSGTRSPAGPIVDVDDQGVWVRIDDALMVAWRLARKKLVQLRLTTIAGSGSPVYRVVSPFSGLITKISSIIELALTSADATLTCGIAGTAITGGVLTVTQSGSAAGDIDAATPSAANYVTAGQELRVTVTGSQAAAAPANVIFEIDAE